jgi:hypothetical protein
MAEIKVASDTHSSPPEVRNARHPAVSESAARRVRRIIERGKGRPQAPRQRLGRLQLRLQYKFALDDKALPDDVAIGRRRDRRRHGMSLSRPPRSTISSMT